MSSSELLHLFLVDCLSLSTVPYTQRWLNEYKKNKNGASRFSCKCLLFSVHCNTITSLYLVLSFDGQHVLTAFNRVCFKT